MWMDVLNRHVDDVVKGRSSGVLHLKQVFARGEAYDARNLISNLIFEPQYEAGKIARYESLNVPISSYVVCVLRQILDEAKRLLFSGRSLKVEWYAFKYDVGHSVPMHRDMNRHKISAIAYFGDFEGGQFIYVDPIEIKEIAIRLDEGDVLVSVNETSNGRNLGPIHKVKPVLSGQRLCIAGSLVDESSGVTDSPS